MPVLLSQPRRHFSHFTSSGHLVEPLVSQFDRSFSGNLHASSNLEGRHPLLNSPQVDHIPPEMNSSNTWHITSPDVISKLIDEYAHKTPTPVSLKHMFEQGKNCTPETLLRTAQFLYDELPVRLAKRAKELLGLPYRLPSQPSVMKVQDGYVQSFTDIVRIARPCTLEDERNFQQIVEGILERHRNVVPLLAQGVLEVKKKNGLDNCPFLQDFLNRFYLSRIGIRMLQSQYLYLHRPTPGFVGVIDSRCSPAEIAENAIHDASLVCERAYGQVPSANIHGARHLRFTYVPTHIHYILFELLKNSMRAVVERHGTEDDLPPVDIVIAEGDFDVTIKVSDQGGGINRREMSKIFTYLYTTAKHPDLSDDRIVSETSPMAGFGYGLPLSRLHARYFGGDLEVISMDGYGTDAYVVLNKLMNSPEPLPH